MENISFFIDDNIEENNDGLTFELTEILNSEYDFKNNKDLYAELIHYDLNYTVKQLLLICEYYGIAKNLRNNKCNKVDILNTLIIYENNIENIEKVNKRKQLWYCANKLKNDKFMKKYILWS